MYVKVLIHWGNILSYFNVLKYIYDAVIACW